MQRIFAHDDAALGVGLDAEAGEVLRVLADGGDDEINAFGDFLAGVDRPAPAGGIGRAQFHAGIGDREAETVAARLDPLRRQQVADVHAFLDAAFQLVVADRHFLLRAPVDDVHRSAETARRAGVVGGDVAAADHRHLCFRC